MYASFFCPQIKGQRGVGREKDKLLVDRADQTDPSVIVNPGSGRTFQVSSVSQDPTAGVTPNAAIN